jgi:rifampin ADP-ribosylating transferase
METKKDSMVTFSTYYHGTKANLKIGNYIVPGYASNYGQNKKANFVYFTATLDAAIWGAELALGDGPGRIFIVTPTVAQFEDDPNLTNKQFPENPTRSYRSGHPLKIVDELTIWEGHSPEQHQKMKDHLADLKAQGIEAILE